MNEIEQNIYSLTRKVSRTVALLNEWEMLHSTGHFIDACPEMKERIDATAARTRDVLTQWGYAAHHQSGVQGSEVRASQTDTAEPKPKSSQ